jgi:hypothetical protein
MEKWLACTEVAAVKRRMFPSPLAVYWSGTYDTAPGYTGMNSISGYFPVSDVLCTGGVAGTEWIGPASLSGATRPRYWHKLKSFDFIVSAEVDVDAEPGELPA